MNEYKIIEIIADVLEINPNKLNAESNYENTNGWDSMATTNIIVALEDELDIDIELDDAEQFISIKNIVNIIMEKYI